MKKSLFIAILILLAGCEGINNYDQITIFEVGHINYAWGYQHSGIIIDQDGKVREFNLPEDWNFCSGGYISAEAMAENIAYCREVTCTVIDQDLKYYSYLLSRAERGKMSDREHQMCDYGERSYCGYIFEPETNRYRRVELKNFGDWYSENNSEEAPEICEWLDHPCKSKININIR